MMTSSCHKQEEAEAGLELGQDVLWAMATW